MAEKKIPYLCGGVMFFLLTQATLPNGTPRDHRGGISDDHSNPLVMRDFIYAFTESDNYGSEKDTSLYLNCGSEGTINLPFNDIAVVTTYDNLVKADYAKALRRMSEFAKWHLNLELKEWLVKALLEIIENDSDIQEDELFYIESSGEPISKADIRNMTEFEFQPFIVGILHYVLIKRRELNHIGVDTLDSFSEQKTRKPRKYTGHIGDGIKRSISVAVCEPQKEESVADTVTTVVPEISEDTRTDDEVIFDNLKGPIEMFAEALNTQKHQWAEQIRQNNKKSDSPENEPETVEAEVVDDEEPLGAAGEDKKITAIKQQTNVIQNGDNNVNVTNNGTMNFNF